MKTFEAIEPHLPEIKNINTYESHFNLPVAEHLADRMDSHEQYNYLYLAQLHKRVKTRLLVKCGVSHIALRLSKIAAIYTKNKLVYVIDRDAKKYTIDKTLTELEQKLDKADFFRANRQYIININFVKSFKAFQKVKLLVEMNVAGLEEPVIISQQTSPAFKKWIEDD